MACSVSHTDDEVEALVQKLIDEDIVRQRAILDLALQFDNACTVKDDLRKAYEKSTNLNNENDQWELSLDIYDFDLRSTPVMCPSSSTRVETSPSTQRSVRIIPGPAGIVQLAKLRKQKDVQLGSDGTVMSTQEYMKKDVEDVGEDENFKSGSWVSTTDYVNANGVKSCSPNVIDDLTMTMKDLSGTIPGTIHHKVIGEGGYEKDIIVGAALILANVSVFSPKPSMHYLNITKKNVV
ncbi:probable transmembrane ascorbate ferrireductase 4 [Tanacetum coccineum]